MMNIEKIPLNALERAAVNVRVTAADAGVKDLAASIKAHGLLQPLIVIPPDGPQGTYEVVDGGRRLAALRKVHGKKNPDVPVIFIKSRDETLAREASLAANVMRVNLHPVDEFEAFAKLAQDSLTEVQIADRFGIDPADVRKRLRLGQLAQEVRDAWRAGKIDVVEAKAFASSSDLDRQREVLAKIVKVKNGWDRGEHSIRRELTGGMVRPDAPRVVLIGGVDAYRAAGGEVEEDLFEGVTRLKDGALVERLAREKLEAECLRLISVEGWAWARLYGDVEDPWQLPGIDFAAHATPEEKKALASKKWQAETDAKNAIQARLCADRGFRATAGVLVEVNHDGSIKARGPYLSDVPASRDEDDERDEINDEQEDEAEEPAEPKTPEAPHPTRLALSEALTAALAVVMKDSPHVALAALTATLRIEFTSCSATPLRLSLDHRRPDPSTRDGTSRMSWHAAFAELAAKPEASVREELAVYASRLLDLRALKHDKRDVRSSGWDREACGQALAGTLPAAVVTAAIAERFDAAAYFAKVPAEMIDVSMIEMGLRPHKGRKAEKVDAAANAARAKAWLPKELRTAHYQGPNGLSGDVVGLQEAAE